MKHSIDIKAESLPWHFKFLGILMILLAIAAIFSSVWWLSIILVFVGLIILTIQSGTEIDHSTKTYREYNSILFFRHGEQERYDAVEKIFINASKVEQRVHPAHTNDSSTFYYTEYNAYLKLSDGKKIFLMSKKNKAAMMNKLKPVAELLETELVDYT
jgi:hypothetical protein